MKRWADKFDFIADEINAETEDWLDAIEHLGVRAMYWDGCHCAYLGKDKERWTNARVATFKSGEDARQWCLKTNKSLHEE